MQWTRFDDGTVRVRFSRNVAAFVHTDRVIFFFSEPDGSRRRYYYHGPLNAEDAGGDRLGIHYADGVRRDLLYPTGTPVQDLGTTSPVSDTWRDPHGRKTQPQNAERYPFDLLWRPPPPPGWAGPWPY